MNYHVEIMFTETIIIIISTTTTSSQELSPISTALLIPFMPL